MRLRFLNEIVHRHWFGISVMVGVWLIFFSRFFFAGQVYFLEDLAALFYPLEHEYARFQAEWRLPVWSSLFGFGQPLLAWGQLGFFTPVHVVLRLLRLHPLLLINVSMAIYFAMGLVGMYCLLRLYRYSSAASALASIVFIFSGFTIYHLVHVNYFVAVLLLPWLLLTITYFFRKPTIRRSLTITIVATSMLVSGHVQMVAYCFMAATLYAVMALVHYGKATSWRRVAAAGALLLLAAVLSVSSAAIAVVPSFEFFSQSDRGQGLSPEELYNFSYPPWHSITLVLPHLYGHREAYFGAKSEQELGGYVGIIPLSLAMLAVLWWPRLPDGQARPRSLPADRRYLVLYGLSCVVVAMVFALGKYSFIYRFLIENQLFPPFTAPSRFLLFFTLGISLLGAEGYTAIKRSGVRHSSAILLTTLSVALPVVLKMNSDERFAAQLHSSHLSALDVATVVAGIAALAFQLIGQQYQKVRRACRLSLLIVTSLTLLGYGWGMYPMVDRAGAVAPPAFAGALDAYAQKHGVAPRLYTHRQILQQTTEATQPGEKRMTDALGPAFTVHQEIKATENDLTCISALIRSNGGADDIVYLTIRERHGGKVLRTVEKSAQRDLAGSSGHFFCFDPIRSSAGHTYLVSFTKPSSASDGKNSSVVLPYRQLPAQRRSAWFVRVTDPNSEQLDRSQKAASLFIYPHYGQVVLGEEGNSLLTRHLNVTAGASNVHWVGSLSLRSYHDFADRFFANDRAQIDGEGMQVVQRHRALFNMGGVTHMIQEVLPGATDTMLNHDFRLAQEALVADKQYRLYENSAAFARAFLVPEAIYEGDPAVVRRRIADSDYDPMKSIYIDQPYGESQRSLGSVDGEATITTYGATRIEVKVKTAHPAWLVVTEATTPEWKTFVDGKLFPRITANTLFKTVLVPPGIHAVSFQYRSPAVVLAQRISIVSLACTATLWVLSKVIEKQTSLRRAITKVYT